MVSKLLKVTHEAGIHARPAAAVVETCSRFKSSIALVKGELRANGKSIMNVMLLAAEYGAEILVEADGPDEQAALDAVDKLFAEHFRQG
ncbi:MAG TPA: HPr family phosphocarrier protein [Fibrobacteria bacterium]|jgi:phosphocarrier protein|nr:HPr family phosphocarrier protein [Fibrobacteria bacterium]